MIPGDRESKKVRRVLIVRYTAIGDVVLTSPLWEALHSAQFEVHLLTSGFIAPLVSGSSFLHAVHDGSEAFWKTQSFDVVFDLQNTLKSKRFLQHVKYKEKRTLKKQNLRKALLVYTKQKTFEVRHVSDRYLDTASEYIDVNKAGKRGLHLHLATSYTGSLSIPEQYVAWAIGATYAGKRMSPEVMLDLCQALQYPLVLLGGSSESAVAQFLTSSEGGENILNLVAKTSLLETAQIIKKARVVLTFDSGSGHIAQALGRPLVRIWGATTPELGFGAFHPSAPVAEIEPKSFWRPTSKLGKQRLLRKPLADGIDRDQVVTAVKDFWEFSGNKTR